MDYEYGYAGTKVEDEDIYIGTQNEENLPKEKTRKTLEFAIDYFQIEKDIPFHRAFSDAYYTAKVFQRLANPDILQFVSFDTFHIPQDKKNEIKIYNE